MRACAETTALPTVLLGKLVFARRADELLESLLRDTKGAEVLAGFIEGDLVCADRPALGRIAVDQVRPLIFPKTHFADVVAAALRKREIAATRALLALMQWIAANALEDVKSFGFTTDPRRRSVEILNETCVGARFVDLASQSFAGEPPLKAIEYIALPLGLF